MHREKRKKEKKSTPPSRTLIFQPGITNKIPGLYLGPKSRLKMNFAGENIAPPYSGQRQEMRLSHEQYSITKSHHPPLQASPKTVPVSRWHFLEVEEKWFADRWSLSIRIWWGRTYSYWSDAGLTVSNQRLNHLLSIMSTRRRAGEINSWPLTLWTSSRYSHA